MRVLVTGGAGFIGSNLCKSLLEQGHEVICVDNLITGTIANIEDLLPQAAFSFVQCNTEQMPDFPVEAIYHLASPASPVGYGLHPLETMMANSEGTKRALDLCREYSAKFLMASTSEVYGDPLQHPQVESYFGNVDPVGPRSCYDEGKRFSEALTMCYLREFAVDARIVRIFNCYGPRNRLDDGRMVPTFISQALRGEPMTILGDGSQTRSLCYVSDLVRGLESAMNTDGTTGEIVNLGNPQEHTVLEFATMIRELSGSQSRIVHLEGREGEIARRKPDATKALTLLGWRAEVDVRDGLSETIEWARQQIRVEVPA